MKKRLLLGIFAILFLVILIPICVFASKNISEDNFDLISAAKRASNNKTVVVVVEGIEIYQETIDFLAIGEEIAQKNSTQYNSVQNASDSVDTDEILQEQIRDAVVLAEAKKQGLEASEKEAREYTFENFEIVKEVGGETYRILQDYMTEMDLTEEEYLEICTVVNRNKLTRANLYNKFAEGKAGTYDEIVTEYEKYVAGLVEKADIEYK